MLEVAAGATKYDAGGGGDVGCEGFGLVLRGGADRGDSDHGRPITVSRVIPNSPADRSAAMTTIPGDSNLLKRAKPLPANHNPNLLPELDL